MAEDARKYGQVTLEVHRRTTCYFRVTVTDAAGQPEDITDWQSFWMTAKRFLRDPDSKAVFRLTDAVGGGLVRLTPEGGVLRGAITPAHTDTSLGNLDHEVALFADVKGKDANGDVWPLGRVAVVVIPDVGHDEEEAP